MDLILILILGIVYIACFIGIGFLCLVLAVAAFAIVIFTSIIEHILNRKTSNNHQKENNESTDCTDPETEDLLPNVEIIETIKKE